MSTLTRFALAVTLTWPLAAGAAPDTDGDGIPDVLDRCAQDSRNAVATCDSDLDGYGNVCDPDFDQNFKVASNDLVLFFAPAFKGIDPAPWPQGMDMNCNGAVESADFSMYFVPKFKGSFGGAVPGPSGLACAGQPYCSPPGCGAAANLAWDSNADGVADSICVSDFDRDGALEIDDVQDALDSLLAAPRRFVTVLPGDFRAPANPSARPGRQRGLLELYDDTELRCQAGAALRGSTAATSSHDFAVVSNDDHANGNRNIVIADCEIDGGTPSSYTVPVSVQTRMGVFLRRTRNSRVERNFVHHTYHSGLYTSNSTGDVFRSNRVEDAGGYGNVSPWSQRLRYPCIYAFSFSGGSVQDFVAEDNVLHRCAGVGLNTRAENMDQPGDVVRNVRFVGNQITDTGSSTGDGAIYKATGSVCMSIRGVDGALISDNTCTSAGAVFFYQDATAYRSQGNEDANSNVTLERLVVTDADAVSGVWVGGYIDGLTVRDVTVRGTRDDDGRVMELSCFVIKPPLRRATFDRLVLEDCGRIGLEQGNPLATGATPDEALTIRDVEISGTGLFSVISTIARPGMWFLGRHEGLVLSGVAIRETTGPAIQFDESLAHARLSDLTVDGVEPGWLGSFNESVAPACNASTAQRWITTANASTPTDCNLVSGTGGARARCACASGVWSPMPLRPHAGIHLAAGSQPGLDVRIENATVANVRDDTGVRIRGAFSDFAVDGLLGVDNSLATDANQDSALEIPSATSDITLSGVQCSGTDPNVSCVEIVP